MVNTCWNSTSHPTNKTKEQTILTLADWYHFPAPQVSKTVAAVLNSTLINGLGRYPGGPLSDLAVINVSHGKRYRY
jgi:iron transport multicopper oxidase